ncbi:HD domain-containing protein [bacterium]|nr:HD domain-containing protein [bacterium]MBU1073098.1 HD domain-containing protein [bacterium]MBU1674414.1 HD domain-containing protein [bacterium]
MTEGTLRRVVDLLTRSARLKHLPRTGWLLRGVEAPESIAAHSHGVALIVLILLDLVDEPLDRGRALAMAVLHDLPEAVMGDMPAPASRYLPAGAKQAAEASILRELVEGTRSAERWEETWREYAAAETAEAKLVHDADQLDKFLQVLIYHRSGHRDVAEFWSLMDAHPWSCRASRELLSAIHDRAAVC